MNLRRTAAVEEAFLGVLFNTLQVLVAKPYSTCNEAKAACRDLRTNAFWISGSAVLLEAAIFLPTRHGSHAAKLGVSQRALKSAAAAQITLLDNLAQWLHDLIPLQQRCTLNLISACLHLCLVDSQTASRAFCL